MKINEIIANAENDLIDSFSRIDDIALYNQNKVLEAFRKNRVALMHFAPTSGYGYDDIGRDTFLPTFLIAKALWFRRLSQTERMLSAQRCSAFCVRAIYCIR